jgi:hypothetical protein
MGASAPHLCSTTFGFAVLRPCAAPAVYGLRRGAGEMFPLYILLDQATGFSQRSETCLALSAAAREPVPSVGLALAQHGEGFAKLERALHWERQDTTLHRERGRSPPRVSPQQKAAHRA